MSKPILGSSPVDVRGWGWWMVIKNQRNLQHWIAFYFEEAETGMVLRVWVRGSGGSRLVGEGWGKTGM